MKKKVMLFVSFMIIMIVMGASDSLRGVFALIFENHFTLSTFEVSLIITVSYIGNLVFLFFGGAFLDRYNKKKVFITVIIIWMLGTLLFILTDNFYLLLLGMFFCMGTSTLINTTINLLVPAVFAASPGLMVNLLFFIQGIGTSTSQTVTGRFATDIDDWKGVNVALLLLALLGLLIIAFSIIPTIEGRDTKKSGYKEIMKQPAFVYLSLIFGFYFIAEHGILNWLMIYATKELNLSSAKSSMFLSIFFGGITLGRLIFAPMVQKLGSKRSILIFGGAGTILYCLGIVLGGELIVLLSLSGVSISIVYPTLVLLIQDYFKKDCVAMAAGTIISAATIFDILFNMAFGALVDSIGLKNSFYILPFSMGIFWLLYFGFTKKVSQVE